MSDSQQPTERILPPPPAAVQAPSRTPVYALLGVGIAILIALLVIIVLIAVPRPSQPAAVAPVPTAPSSTPVPSVSAPAPPTADEPEPGFTSLEVATFDMDGMSIKDACEMLRSDVKQNRDRLEVSIAWETAGVEYVEARMERSDRSELEANGNVLVELDCFTKSGDIGSTDVELRAYDSEGDEIEVLKFRVYGNGDVAEND